MVVKRRGSVDGGPWTVRGGGQGTTLDGSGTCCQSQGSLFCAVIRPTYRVASSPEPYVLRGRTVLELYVLIQHMVNSLPGDILCEWNTILRKFAWEVQEDLLAIPVRKPGCSGRIPLAPS